MSLIKFRRRMPLIDRGIPTWFDTSDIFDDDFFENGKSLPPMNVKETESTFDIELAIPDFQKTKSKYLSKMMFSSFCRKGERNS